MDKLKQIAELVKRRKAVLDDCVRELRKADASENDDAREAAVSGASHLLSRVQVMTAKIDELYAEQIGELERLRGAAAEQGAAAIAAAQGAIVRMTGGGSGTNGDTAAD